MTPVTAKYNVVLTCSDATGSNSGRCVGAKAVVELTIETTKMTLLTGSGNIQVSATLREWHDSKGTDMLVGIPPEQRSLAIASCRIGAGRITMTLQLDGISIEASCYLDCDGSKLTHGFAKAEVTKFLWRFFVKTLEADFSGELVNKEILGS